tara:strand:+ start:346 stop:1353 length:1008 start_codon:yes stop_codon:yes gene_type:complete
MLCSDIYFVFLSIHSNAGVRYRDAFTMFANKFPFFSSLSTALVQDEEMSVAIELHQHSPSFEVIDMSVLFRPSFLSPNLIRALSSRRIPLKRLNISNCSHLSPDDVAPFALESLEELICTGSDCMTDSLLLHFANRCPQLAHYNVAGCANVTSRGVEMLCRVYNTSRGITCPLEESSLLSLNMSGMVRKGVSALHEIDIMNALLLHPLLEVLDLSDNLGLPTHTLSNIVGSLVNLQKLDLSYSKKTGSYHSVTDEVLKSIGQSCKQLRELRLTGCTHISNEGVKAIATGCRLLEKIDLNYCHNASENNISGPSIIALAKHMKSKAKGNNTLSLSI